eukprot:TRINITY_DN4955_c0_g1_i1.p1 TRINITY_DN4955_c0_g1~~TRINITY_DN4955_c0_g1_i1.p1  ORF type:complete len:138 (-),score=12.20 TRINITY_DN4955_c0_g1_i1:9-422(-)
MGTVKITQWISFISDTVFRVLEHSFIKPILSSTNNLKNTEKVIQVLGILNNELLIQQNSNTTIYPTLLATNTPTWVDLYLLPIIADLEALSEGKQLLEQHAQEVYSWFKRFKEQDVFLNTYEGTLAHQMEVAGKSSL